MTASPTRRPSRLLLATLALFIALDLYGLGTTVLFEGLPASVMTASGLKLAGLVLLAAGLLGRDGGRLVLRPRRLVLGFAATAYLAGLILNSLGPAPFLGVVLLGSYPFAIPALIAWQDLRRSVTPAHATGVPTTTPPVDARGYSVSVVVGLAVGTTVPLLTALAGQAVPEWIPQLTWLGMAVLGSAGLGYLFPNGSTRWALIILVLQPLIVYGALFVSGEIQNPTSSTGGEVAVFIIAGFCVILSPFVILAGRFGRSLKERALFGPGVAQDAPASSSWPGGGPAVPTWVTHLGSLVLVGVWISAAYVWAGRAGDARDLYRAAASPRTDIDSLRTLAQVDDDRLRWAILENPNVDADILRVLANEREFEPAVASHPRTPEDLLRDYAGRNSPDLNASLARNPGTPTEILGDLGNDPSPPVRRNLAGNPRTPASVLGELYLDGPLDSVTRVHEALAGNPNTPTPVLEELYSLLQPDSRRHRYVLVKLGSNPNSPRGVITSIANSPDLPLRRATAENPSAPEDVLQSLATSVDWLVRAAVAGNPGTPQALLEELGRDPDRRVGRAVAYNPSYVGATVRLAGVELERQPDVWKAVQTGRNSFLFSKRVATLTHGVNLESYPFATLRSRTGIDEVDLSAIAADISTYVNSGPDSQFTDPSHRTIRLGDREWGWTTFEGRGGSLLNYVYAPACDHVISLRFSHSKEAMSEEVFPTEFDGVTALLRPMRKSCDGGDRVGFRVRPEGAGSP